MHPQIVESNQREANYCSTVADGKSDPWYKCIPVSINCAYGDPLLKTQIEDTCRKLESLTDHLAPVGFCTKGIMTDAAYERFSSLKPSNNIVIRYSLTGLDEAGFTFEQRVDTIQKLCQLFGSSNIIISPRPIIAGRNDSYDNLARIVQVAAKSGQKLIIGGLHNTYKHKTIAEKVEGWILRLCERNSVKVFYKSSCASAFTKGTNCWMHDLGAPQNLAVVEDLGYDFNVVDERIRLSRGTTGDLNFLRVVTASDISTESLVSNYNLVSFSNEKRPIEHTSSWYAWARNLPSCLACDYCIINDIEYLDRNRKDVGIHPVDLSKFARLLANDVTTGLPMKRLGGKFARIPAEDNEPHRSSEIRYNTVRVKKPCMTHAYS